MVDIITIFVMKCCDDFPNAPIYRMHVGNGRLRRTRGHL